MHFQSGSTAQKRNKVMSPEQFKQVVEAITEGRYSWACVLILRFADYNPIHFIPHRTYSRLMKENRLFSQMQDRQLQPDRRPLVTKGATQINELAYLETIEPPENAPHGGSLPAWFEDMVKEPDSLKQGFLARQQVTDSSWCW
ncbi:HetP family heterocyst commitment protein [Phormidesmis priestleyi]|uniref:HetP family heterocyst commitment protein n=1 Tax=Phormidesmis priestleyi TaxID=268141 RepID=UPI000932E321|nr:HetP family heterocyst commitment protein [Phormidesmis priestleyi]